MDKVKLIRYGENDIRMSGIVYTREWKVKKITFEGEVYSKEECINNQYILDESFEKYINGDEDEQYRWSSFDVDIFKCLGVPDFKIYHFSNGGNAWFNNSTNLFVDLITEANNVGLLPFIPKDKYNNSCLYNGKPNWREDEFAVIELCGYGFNNFIHLDIPFTTWLSYDISKLIPQVRLQKKTTTLSKYYNTDKGYLKPKEDMSEADKCKVLLEYAEIITSQKQKQLNYR